jgi:hypothetical protein
VQSKIRNRHAAGFRSASVLWAALLVALPACATAESGYRDSQWYDAAIEVSSRYAGLFSSISSKTDGIRRDLLTGADEKDVYIKICSVDEHLPSIESRVSEVRALLDGVASTGVHAPTVRRHLEGVLVDSATLKRRIEQQWYETEGLKITPGERCVGEASLVDVRGSVEEHFKAILLLK